MANGATLPPLGWGSVGVAKLLSSTPLQLPLCQGLGRGLVHPGDLRTNPLEVVMPTASPHPSHIMEIAGQQGLGT